MQTGATESMKDSCSSQIYEGCEGEKKKKNLSSDTCQLPVPTNRMPGQIEERCLYAPEKDSLSSEGITERAKGDSIE